MSDGDTSDLGCSAAQLVAVGPVGASVAHELRDALVVGCSAEAAR